MSGVVFVGGMVLMLGGGHRAEDHVVQVRHVAGDAVLRGVSSSFRFGKGGVGQDQGGGSLEAVSDPAELNFGNRKDARGVFEGVAGSVDQFRLDAVHQTASDALDRAPQQHDDRGGDDDADDRVRKREPDHHPDRPEDHREGSEPVQASMNAVRNEGRGADLLADSDSVDRDEFVAGEADQARQRHEPEVVQGLRVEQPVDGFHSSHDGGEGDDGDDEQSGEIFGAPEPVGIAAGRDAAAEDERDPQRDSSQGIGKVVDRVRQECDGPTDEEDQKLQNRRPQKDEKTDFQRPNTLRAGLEGVVDGVGRVMGVRDEEAIEKPFDPGRVRVTVFPVVMTMAVLMRVSMVVMVVLVAGRRVMIMLVVVVVVDRGVVRVIVGGAHAVASRSIWWW